MASVSEKCRGVWQKCKHNNDGGKKGPNYGEKLNEDFESDILDRLTRNAV